MSAALGESEAVVAFLDPANLYVPGAYTVKLGPQEMGVGGGVGAFECYHITIQGPPGSNFQVYVGNNFYDYVLNGDINSWDPNQPMKLVYGNVVKFFWNVSTGDPIPTVQMYFQESS